MDTFLGIDYGRERIGVARSAGTLAEPIGVIPNTEFSEVVEKIATLASEFSVTQLVVGISEREMAEESRVFGENLARDLRLPVVFTDETLSSVEVTRRLNEARGHKKAYRGPIDHYAAALILERYLEDHA